MIISPRLINYLFIFLSVALIGTTVLLFFWKKLYSRLSVRIALLILGSGLVTLTIALAFNAITADTLSPTWFRLLQIAVLILGGPAVLGFLAARFVRRPLHQFNGAIASLEQSNYRVELQPTGIHEFDEVFTKFNDLTRRLQHEEKLRKDLVSDTSHELNTPLTVMIGQLTAMQEGKHSMTKERVAILKEQAERLAELVHQLDAYTKARMPAVEELEDIYLRQFCEELMKHFNLELKEKGITTKLDIAEDYIIHANHDALQRILTNLMQNTLRYSLATEVTIEATAHKLLFSDNGRGVPADSLPYLFERFYRVDKSRNRTTGGLGLGLAIVRELADSQGWAITAIASHPGLTFVLKINA
ncbi:MAG TPA: HAMP domain-containing sensor histidine kinase [Candidatus Saccharimonadales bacterium]|jgi:signal transduction histidine kinase|nr:HAMP domain-containing sensor histidine kinase [Candidatus Saccharimonadales bacterium]